MNEDLRPVNSRTILRTMSFHRRYRKILPTLRKARAEIRAIIREQLAKLNDPDFVRAKFRQSRIKSFESLDAKARRNRWGEDAAFTKTGDLIGFRIVCSNLEDLSRAKHLIIQSRKLRQIGEDQDYVRHPKDSGYRALQFNTEYSVKNKNGKKTAVRCEIQIRTYLQDTWAELAHRDIYKEGEDLPEPIVRLSKRLADLLAVADSIAQDLREQVSAPREVPAQRPAEISQDAIAFVYHRAYSESPSDYLTAKFKNLCEQHAIRLDAFERKALDRDFNSRLREAYHENAARRPNSAELLELTIHALIKGDEKAIERAGEWGRKEARSQKRSKKTKDAANKAALERALKKTLPKTSAEFLRTLPDLEDDDVINIASKCDALGTCAECNANVVDHTVLARALSSFYGTQVDTDVILKEMELRSMDRSSNSQCAWCYFTATQGG